MNSLSKFSYRIIAAMLCFLLILSYGDSFLTYAAAEQTVSEQTTAETVTETAENTTTQTVTEKATAATTAATTTGSTTAESETTTIAAEPELEYGGAVSAINKGLSIVGIPNIMDAKNDIEDLIAAYEAGDTTAYTIAFINIVNSERSVQSAEMHYWRTVYDQYLHLFSDDMNYSEH